jgi:hypothetical protein
VEAGEQVALIQADRLLPPARVDRFLEGNRIAPTAFRNEADLLISPTLNQIGTQLLPQ